tara:strand:- start:904 stop:1695 length:792 start_codon:yes stop_codon:yes gene_type:complete
MNIQDWIPAFTTTAVFSGALWVFREWIAKRFQASTQHGFDKKLEEIKAAVREKESEIQALQSGAFGRRTARQSILEQKRIEAAEVVWADTIRLSQLKANAQWLSLLNLEEIQTSTDEVDKIREFFSVIGNSVPSQEKLATQARNYRPFIDDVVWSFYELFSSILLYYYTYTEFAKMGELKLLKANPPIKDLLKKTMPHYSEYVEKYGATSYYHLLDDIQDHLLRAIQKMLDGIEFDKAEVERAADILKATEEFRLNNSNQKQT